MTLLSLVLKNRYDRISQDLRVPLALGYESFEAAKKGDQHEFKFSK